MIQKIALLACLVFAPPDFESYTPVELSDAQDCRDWDEARWCDFLYRRIDNESRGDALHRAYPTATGQVIDIYHEGRVAWDVAVDEDWREAIVGSLRGAIGTEADPGVWLLVPDARTRHYYECLAVVQYLRVYGVPMQIRTTTIPERER